jgi:hypothetical protein
MKKLFIAILSICFVNAIGYSQGYPIIQNLGSDSTLIRIGQTYRGAIKGILMNSTFLDTTAANLTHAKDYQGAQIFTTNDSVLWVRQKNGSSQFWFKVGGAGGGATGSFWNLTGNYLVNIPLGFGVGTNSDDNLPFKTNGLTRIILPENGILRSSAAVNKYLMMDTTTKLMYYGDANTATPGIDDVLAVGQTLTAFRIIRGGGNRLDFDDESSIHFTNQNGVFIDNYLDIDGFNFKGVTSGGSNSVFISTNAPSNLRSGNVSVGYEALRNINNNTASSNTAVGYIALSQNLTGGKNVAIGAGAMASSTSPDFSIAIGYNALQVNDTSYNIAIGANALSFNTIGVYNVAIGGNSQSSSTNAGFNTSVGYQSLASSTTGNINTAIGATSLTSNTTGTKNVAAGAGSLEDNTTGSFNVGVGQDAILNNKKGGRNVGIGWNALAGLGVNSTDSSNQNIGIGYLAGDALRKGDNNTFVGYASGLGANGQEDTVTNSTAIGANSYTTKSNQQVFGNSSMTETIIYGIASGNGTKALRYDPSINKMFYADTTTVSGTRFGVSGEDVLATATRSFDLGGNNFFILDAAANMEMDIKPRSFEVYNESVSGIRSADLWVHPDDAFVQTSDSLGNTYLLGVGLGAPSGTGVLGQVFNNITNAFSRARVQSDNITFEPWVGTFKIDTLNYTLSTIGKKIMLRDTASGLVQNIDPALLSGSPGGSNKQIQFNNSSSFGGSSNMTQESGYIKVAATGSTAPLQIIGHEDIGAGDIVEVYEHGAGLNFAVRQDTTVSLADHGGASSTVSTPASGYGKLYNRADSLRFKNHAGLEFTLGKVATALNQYQIGVGNGSNVLSGSSSLTYDGHDLYAAFFDNATSFCGPTYENTYSGSAIVGTTYKLNGTAIGIFFASNFSNSSYGLAEGLTFRNDNGKDIGFSTGSLGSMNGPNLLVNRLEHVSVRKALFVGDITTTPISTVDNSGSLGLAISTVTTNTTLSSAYYTVLVDATSGNITITLDAASGNTRRIYVVKKIDATANTVTIARSGSDTIDGATSKVLSSQYSGYVIQSNGSNYYIVGSF